jgi:sporulation protein YqfD
MERINQLVQSRGDQLELIGQNGVYWGLRRLIRRPLLICSVLFLIVMSMYLPTKVLFIQVEGNRAVPTNLILEQAAECGIRFGTGTRQVRSEKMKNALLQRIPQLQWAGINTSGCTAVISVREKTHSDKSEQTYPISSLVAIRDGYVTNVSVTAGSAACKIGQSVKAGQMLISAYTDCGLYIQAVRAKGEIFADTSRQSTVLTL